MTNIIKLSSEKSEEQQNKKEDKPESKNKEEINEKARNLYTEYLHCSSDPKKHISECLSLIHI